MSHNHQMLPSITPKIYFQLYKFRFYMILWAHMDMILSTPTIHQVHGIERLQKFEIKQNLTSLYAFFNSELSKEYEAILKEEIYEESIFLVEGIEFDLHLGNPRSIMLDFVLFILA